MIEKKYGRDKSLSIEQLKKLKENSKSELCFCVAEKIRKFIYENDLSDKDFANMCDIPKSSISAYINGETEMKIDSLVKIAKVMNVSTDYLLGNSDFKSPMQSDIDINKEIGLSELAITNLKVINGGVNKWLLKTINYLLESEMYFEDEYDCLGVINDIDEGDIVKAEEYLDKVDELRKKHNPQYVITKLDEYFNTNIGKEMLFITKNNVYKEEELSDLQKSYINAVGKKIPLEDKLVNNVLLDEIKMSLIQAKQQYNKK